MSAMTMGGMIEADRRLRDHEARIRENYRAARRASRWSEYEDKSRD